MKNEELLYLISKYNIDVLTWKKSINKLLNEISEGSCRIFENNKKLYREVSVAVMFCTFNNVYYIAEERINSDHIEYLLTEKVDIPEKPNDACFRGLKEELGFIQPNDYKDVKFIDVYEEIKESSSYPGIIGIFKYFAYYIKLNKSIEKTKFDRIDHDNKKLNFKLIKLDDFTEPNKIFIDKLIF